MGLFELFGKKPVATDAIYSLQAEIHPFRLNAHKNESVDLIVNLKNNLDKELLTSIVAVVQKPLSTDQTGLTQQREVRIGLLQPKESKRTVIPVWATQRTDPGTYKIKVFAISHYRDYGHILNEARKILDLRVV
jgi:uncharacterized membrane protein